MMDFYDIGEIKEELKNLDFIKKTRFSGSSPPEIFIGREGYPYIYTGILSPISYGDTESFSSPEKWFKQKLTIPQIIDYRKQLIYSRFKTKVKDARKTSVTSGDNPSSLLKALNQISMAEKSVSAEFNLVKPATFSPIREYSVPIIGNPAPLKHIKLEENPKISKHVDYVVSDNRLKASKGIQSLYAKKIDTSNIIKVFSAGLLGLKTQRKIVPTKWSITAVDDALGKSFLRDIRTFKEVNEIEVFNGEYLGNHYEILILPDKWSYEIIEISESTKQVWQDHELFFDRKTYAEDVTGGYYAARLGVCEYLHRIKRQGTVIIFREVRKEYNAPLGVGILRELVREILSKNGKQFPNINEAINDMSTRIHISMSNFTEKSFLLRDFGKQKKITEWF